MGKRGTLLLSCIIGELYWEAWLAGLVMPSECKVHVSTSRVEIKLKKAKRNKWEEFKVVVPTALQPDVTPLYVPTEILPSCCFCLLELLCTNALLSFLSFT